MNFSTWLESRQFRRLIPEAVLTLVPLLKKKGLELTNLYFNDKSSVANFTLFTKLDDPFFPGKMRIGFITAEEANKRGYSSGQGFTSPSPLPDIGERAIYYKIPVTYRRASPCGLV